MPRKNALLLVALVSAAALTGCFGNADSPAADPAPRADPPADSPAPRNEGAASPVPPAKPQADIVAQDAGSIEGQFEKAWAVSVPEAGYDAVVVAFKLLPPQEGAPVTARVFLTFEGPDGTPIRSVTLGLGGAEKMEYRFSPGELAPGEYMLSAKSEPTQAGGIPSMGFAKYEFAALTDY